MRKLLMSLFIFFFLHPVCSADTLTLVKKIEGAVSFFTTDHLGNSYLVTAEGMFKYDKDGNSIASYTDKTFGNIQFTDATDPLKVLIYNKDFGVAKTLDVKLSLQSSINLHELNLQQPLLMCTSRHNGYWIFDKQTNQLKKIDSSLQPVYESSDISQLATAEINPVFLIESDRWLWLNNAPHGILLFDMFGTYIKTLDVKEVNPPADFQTDFDKIIYNTGDTLKEINQSNFTTKEISYPQLKDVLKMRVEQGRLYILKKDTFEIYSF